MMGSAMSLEHSPTRYLTSKQVRSRYGNISDMSLWRWQNDAKLDFPKPIKVKGRKLFALAALERWESERAAEALQESAVVDGDPDERTA